MDCLRSSPLDHNPLKKRVPLGLGGQTSAAALSHSCSTERNSLTFGREDAGKGSHLRSRPSAVLPFENLPRSEKRRVLSPCDRSGQPEQVNSVPSVQNDQPPLSPENYRPPLLDGVAGHQGCFPSHPGQREPSQVPSDNLQQQAVFLQNPSFRPSHEPPHLHFCNETPSGHSSCSGNSCHWLFGRFIRMGGLTSRGSRFSRQSGFTPYGSRFCFEFAEILPDTHHQHDLAGSGLGFGGGDNQSSQALCLRDPTNGPQDAPQGHHYSPPLRGVPRQNCLCRPDLPSSKTIIARDLETSANIPQGSGQGGIQHSCLSIVEPSSLEQANLSLGPLSYEVPTSPSDGLDGRLYGRLGRLHVNRPKLCRQMVPC